MDKKLIPPTHHSKQLLEAIDSVRKTRQDAQESTVEGQWYIKDGEAILGGPSPTQWAAWMEAAYGKSSNQ